jgi:hypothetical protein
MPAHNRQRRDNHATDAPRQFGTPIWAIGRGSDKTFSTENAVDSTRAVDAGRAVDAADALDS